MTPSDKWDCALYDFRLSGQVKKILGVEDDVITLPVYGPTKEQRTSTAQWRLRWMLHERGYRLRFKDDVSTEGDTGTGAPEPA